MLLLGTLALSGVTITLPMEAHASGTEIMLGDVAQVIAEDEALAKEIESLSLGYAPAPGFSRLIWNHNIAELVHDHDRSLAVQFQGQRATRIWPLTETVKAESITQAAELSIIAAVQSGDYTWELREAVHDVDVPASDDSAALIPKPARGALDGGVMAVPVEVRVAGETYRTIWTSWSVNAWQTVPVLTRRVPAGRRVNPASIKNERLLSHPNRAAKPLTREMLLGATAARDLAPGEVVTELDVHRPPAINTGDTIFLEVRKGAVAARVPALARQSGAIGDRIRVIRSDAPGLEMSAVVASRELARIDLGGLTN